MNCCDITPGQMRHKIEIKELQEVDDKMGGQGTEWVTVWTKRAKIVGVSGSERLRSMQLNATSTHKMTMRYFAGLTEKHQIVFDGRLFQIRYIDNVEEKNRFYIVTCEEGVAQ